jgi:hypothetical protein
LNQQPNQSKIQIFKDYKVVHFTNWSHAWPMAKLLQLSIGGERYLGAMYETEAPNLVAPAIGGHV